MNIFGFTWLDWLVIIVYLIGITIIGSWALKKVKSAASFFISDRKSGKIMMMFYTFGTGTHSDQAVSVAAKTYGSGASGIWYQWLWLFVTPFFCSSNTICRGSGHCYGFSCRRFRVSPWIACSFFDYLYFCRSFDSQSSFTCIVRFS